MWAGEIGGESLGERWRAGAGGRRSRADAKDIFNYTAIGDTVNLAQRLQATAEPGEILLQNTTYEIVAERVAAEALDPIVVRGRQMPVQVYRFMGLK